MISLTFFGVISQGGVSSSISSPKRPTKFHPCLFCWLRKKIPQSLCPLPVKVVPHHPPGTHPQTPQETTSDPMTPMRRSHAPPAPRWSPWRLPRSYASRRRRSCPSSTPAKSRGFWPSLCFVHKMRELIATKEKTRVLRSGLHLRGGADQLISL